MHTAAGERLPARLAACAVHRITGKRVPDICHVYADLMCTSRFKRKFKQCIVLTPRFDPIMRDGTLSVGAHAAFHLVGNKLHDRCIHGALILPDRSADKRCIRLFDLSCQNSRRMGVFCTDTSRSQAVLGRQ